MQMQAMTSESFIDAAARSARGATRLSSKAIVDSPGAAQGKARASKGRVRSLWMMAREPPPSPWEETPWLSGSLHWTHDHVRTSSQYTRSI